jgi:hypothetical protein
MKSALLSISLLTALVTNAQVQPEFEFQLGTTISKIKWMQQSNTGSLIAATDQNLVGIDPQTKKINWEIKELGSATEDKFENIPGTPYFIVETKQSLGLGTPQLSIIESESGKIIFNSKEADMKIYSKRPLYKLGGLLIDGKKGKRDFISLLDFSTGKERWTKDLGESRQYRSCIAHI